MCAHSIALPAVNRDAIRDVIHTGFVAAVVGVLAFASIHALLIVPIWTQALTHAPAALAAGIAIAWAFEARFAGSGVKGMKDGAAFGALLFASLVPATAFENAVRLAHLRLPDALETAAVLALAALSGAVAGRAGLGRTSHFGSTTSPGRRRYGGAAFAVATLALTTLMGGPIPFVNSSRAMWLFLAFLPICVAAGLALAAHVVRRQLIRR